MAQVTVKINGYSYTVGCEDGQEQHLARMAEQVESRIDSIKQLGGQSGEARLLVLASLLMADELHDMKVEMEAARAATPAPRGARKGGEGDSARRLSKLAARAEQIAADLEQP
ncbi:MAG: cell division protein ZapA [Acetobacteraceae bacterium SCN 69-10]|nr:cell division protein ZapA [Rhodospirillales bacterium]ODU53753.1 MAG: cell division protein ZapA [Acetobacteraceae bacterium SCN 69-10]OJY64786.1 MAG: cell division protein ZapA [Rhodospirillales bacterium 70-18]